MITWQTKSFYLYHHNAHNQETRQGGDLPGGAPTHINTRPFDQVVLQDHMKN